MKKERRNIKLSDLVQNKGQIEWLPRNPRKWGKTEIENLIRSLDEDPDFMDDRPPLVTPCDGKFLVFAGNMRTTAEQKRKVCKELGCMVYIPEDDTDQMTIIRRAAKDNGSWGKWDFDILANEWDSLPLTDWGVPAWETEDSQNQMESGEMAEDEIERKAREFKEKMESGEMAEDDPEYLEFLEKFKLKKTTDDCYTPEVVYNAVADWVSQEYNIEKRHFVRPFYPGGDYQSENYGKNDIVVDNPPFSIMSEIVNFYLTKGVRFFLFAPNLTVLNYNVCAICTGVGVTYENGAVVQTSFLTNLGDNSIRAMSCPELYGIIKKANDDNLKASHKELPKFEYDGHVVTASLLNQLSKYSLCYVLKKQESMVVRELDAMKEFDKAIYGQGLLISDRKKEEMDRKKEEMNRKKEKYVWSLSPRELELVKSLN